MYTIKNNCTHEIIINKSRFICFLIKINSEENAKDVINNIKKKYEDASHWCYGYIIDNIKRFSDDGEPDKTAGLPILNVLENNNLNKIICIVVRYFGGIKLGTGGLVRAYTKSVTENLKKVELTELVNGKNIKIIFNYDRVKIIDNILNSIYIKEKKFDDKIKYSFDLTDDEYDNIIDNIKNNILNLEIIDNIIIEKNNNKKEL